MQDALRDALLMAAASDGLARQFAVLCRPLGTERGGTADPHLEGTPGDISELEGMRIDISYHES